MSDCGVCVSGDIDGYVELAECSTVKGRKEYRCSECRQAIHRGQEHQYFKGMYDGGFFSARTCLICAEICGVFACGSVAIGDFWSDMAEQVFPILTTGNECFAKLSPAAKAFVLDRWRKWKGLAE